MKIPDDKHILNQIRKGDVSAFSILIGRYRHMVYTLAFQLLKNHEDAEEVAQDAFFKAYKGLSKFEGRSSFSTWIYRITYHESISRLRKHKHEQVSFEEEQISRQPFHFDEQEFRKLEADDRKHFLNEALTRIKSEEAAVLTLFYFDELSVDEIAEVTGFSASNVKVKLHRGRHSLLAELRTLLKGEVNSLL